jgi:ketosteroid isomerase-like protein
MEDTQVRTLFTRSVLSVSCAALIAVTLSFPAAFGRSTTSSSDTNKRMAQLWFIDVIEKKNPNKIDELVADDAVLELAPSYKSNISGTNKVAGKSEIKKHMADFADLTGEVVSEEVQEVSDGNNVAMYRLITTKYKNGKTIKTPWAIFFTFKNGKIASIKHVHDTLLEQQQHQQFEQSQKK